MSTLDVVRDMKRERDAALDRVLSQARVVTDETKPVPLVAIHALRQRVQAYDLAAFREKVATREVYNATSAEVLLKIVNGAPNAPQVEIARIGAGYVSRGEVVSPGGGFVPGGTIQGPAGPLSPGGIVCSTFNDKGECVASVRFEPGEPMTIEKFRKAGVAPPAGAALVPDYERCDPRKHPETGATCCVLPKGHETGGCVPGDWPDGKTTVPPPPEAAAPATGGPEIPALPDPGLRAHPFVGETVWRTPGASLQHGSSGDHPFELILSTDRIRLTSSQAAGLARAIEKGLSAETLRRLEGKAPEEPPPTPHSSATAAALQQEAVDRQRSGATLPFAGRLAAAEDRISALKRELETAMDHLLRAGDEYKLSETGRRARMAEIEKGYASVDARLSSLEAGGGRK